MSPASPVTEPTPKTFAVIGLPASGKTTFIAAVWYSITRAERGSDLELIETPPDLSYLNGLMDHWLACEVAAHTSIAASHTSEITVKGPGELPVRLVIPDYSGEFLRDAWATRRMAGQVDRYLRSADGVVVLVHPKIVPRVTLEEANANAMALDGGPPNVELKANPFDLKASPTQTQLVDLLQFARTRSRKKRLSVAVVLSAWDLAEKDGPPGDWLRKNLPLLSQFLATNQDVLPSAVFGVSAQGDNWEANNTSSLGRLPMARPWAVDADGARMPDVAAAIRWLVKAS